MTPLQAREALQYHAGAHPQIDNPRWTHGFLGSLRPFSGLRDENFHEVMEALRALAFQLQGESVDRETIACLWCLCHLARAWGVHPDGMLRSNGLISDSDATRLESWVETISYAVMCILDGAADDAFADYDSSRKP